jgi:hypothetical protein
MMKWAALCALKGLRPSSNDGIARPCCGFVMDSERLKPMVKAISALAADEYYASLVVARLAVWVSAMAQ